MSNTVELALVSPSGDGPLITIDVNGHAVDGIYQSVDDKGASIPRDALATKPTPPDDDPRASPPCMRVADDAENSLNCCARNVEYFESLASQLWLHYGATVRKACYVIMALAYIFYVLYAFYFHFGDEGSMRLLVITCFVAAFVLVKFIRCMFGERIAKLVKPIKFWLCGREERISWITVCVLYLVVVTVAIIDVLTVSKNYYNLISGAGLVSFILVCFLFSRSPAKVRWRIVAWGTGLQLAFALLILRTQFGLSVVRWSGERLTDFVQHADAGSRFVFGETYAEHFFAFKILPVIIFFGAIISVLYHLGVMQFVFRNFAWIMHFTMGTTAAESLNAAGNVFLGMNESFLLVGPVIGEMTRSEYHAILTSGYATVAGGIMAAYIAFGIPADHLLSASVMSAPAALAISKILYPETEQSKTTANHVKYMPKSAHRNIIEAASQGASQTIKLVASIAANLIAFMAALSFINSLLIWIGQRVGVEKLTFELICGYAFWPIALAMGVPAVDCGRVAEMVGVKVFINEYVAYERLGHYVSNGRALAAHLAINGITTTRGLDVVFGNGTVLQGGVLEDRSIVISTYALCGFANFISVGIVMSALATMAPRRRRDIVQVAVRAMVAGNIACFMTASVAGLLFNGFN